MRREYPTSPIAAVAAVIFSDSNVLLVRRLNDPSKGRLGLPGGVVELGEKIEEALVREVVEETGIIVKPKKIIDVFDSIIIDNQKKIQFHYVLFEFLCEVLEGDFKASSDVCEALWIPLTSLGEFDLLQKTRMFIEKVALKVKF